MSDAWPIVALAALLGLLVGSFGNVVAYRVPRGESIAYPPSHCTSCQAPIAHRHNVPVLGWLVLAGRCASCRAPISVRYPLVEAWTGAAFAGVAAWAGLTARLPAGLLLVAAGTVLTSMAIDRLRNRPRRRFGSGPICRLVGRTAGHEPAAAPPRTSR